jgi:anti-sigma28 factor (negative regulator of flagellin synthesis)
MNSLKHDATLERKRGSKQQQKEAELKKKYNLEIDAQQMRKFANSSYLTPEAAMYLNEAMREGAYKVDSEVVYAGLHEAAKDKKQFQRTQKFSTKYTKGRQSKRKKKGRFG